MMPNISVDNLFQATYVWYGLWNFWELVAATRSCNEEAQKYAVERSQFIAEGFKRLDIGIFGDALSEEVLPGLEHISAMSRQQL